VNKGNLSRRGFMQRSLAALAATGVPLWYARELVADETKPTLKKVDANDRIVMGAIGIGSLQSRGRAIMGEASKQEGIQYVAVCDVDKRHREKAVEDVKKVAKIKGDVKAYEDFRELLDDKNINAVTIATPDHWHALVAIAALKKGKDVYCEKPLSLTVAEGRAIAKVAKVTGRIFQVGSQQRCEFGNRFRLACELVRNGRIGKLKSISARVGGNPQSPELPEVDPPEGLNWDFWLGPTPKVPYRYLEVETKIKKDKDETTLKRVYTNCHYEFRWFYEYSGGKITDWGAHHNDIAQWALGMDDSGPVAVESTGTKPEKPNGYNCHPDFEIHYTYANGVKLTCQAKGENGVRFEGEDSKWIFVSRSRIQASDKKLIEEELPEDAVTLYPTPAKNHMANFIECVRSRKATICPAEVGHRSATVCHIGAIALRLGKKLKWDPIKERFDDEEANKMLSRAYRAPWKLEA
jgi:predicted dehydrogenase